MTTIYMNEQYLPLEQATVSVEDRGFLFGDGIYEVVRLYGGRPFRLEAHLQRLHRSAEGTRMPLPAAVSDLPSIIERVRAENKLHNSEIYIECTRGPVHPRSHSFPAVANPTLLVMPLPLRPLPESALTLGVATITVPDIRWHRCDIKSIMLLPSAMAKQQARENDAHEAIFIRNGIVTEGASTNILSVIEGTLRTHPANEAILAGITRQVVLELAAELEQDLREEPFTRDQMYGADEVFLASTTNEVLPITRIDGHMIGEGRPGHVTMRLRKAFRERTLSEENR
ncbi:MAG TPA: D-amino-acid transaminase [Anaerolineae bacterium]|nr:D-amino-acid transaminase [Anaerolineae bacterium]